MFPKLISIILVILVLLTHSATAYSVAAQSPQVQKLSEVTYSLSDRYSNSYVSNVFSDNILLTLAYMRGIAKNGQAVDWNKVKGDFTYTMVLQHGQTFAFHDQVLSEYKGKIAETTNAHFDSTQGFESDGWLVGDGVCHLASFMNVAALKANLGVVAPTPHDFAVIPDVPKRYGVAIYYMPGESGSSSLQNLYITNTFDKSVAFVFTHKGSNLSIRIEKIG